MNHDIPKSFIDSLTHAQCFAALMCFGCVRFDQLGEWKEYVKGFIEKNPVKVTEYTLPFLCKELKQRMLVFLLCVKRLCGSLGKDVKMLLFDYAYSN